MRIVESERVRYYRQLYSEGALAWSLMCVKNPRAEGERCRCAPTGGGCDSLGRSPRHRAAGDPERPAYHLGESMSSQSFTILWILGSRGCRLASRVKPSGELSSNRPAEAVMVLHV